MLIKITTVFSKRTKRRLIIININIRFIWIHNTSTTVQRSFVQDYLQGEPVPEETFIHSHPWGRRRIRTDNKVCFEPIKPAYNQSRPPLTDYGSVCGQSWSQYLCYAELAASFINFLHYYSPSSGFHGKDNRGRQSIWTSPHPDYRCPTSTIPHFTPNAPSCRHPPNLVWLETSTPNNTGLHTQWLGSPSGFEFTKHYKKWVQSKTKVVRSEKLSRIKIQDTKLKNKTKLLFINFMI